MQHEQGGADAHMMAQQRFIQLFTHPSTRAAEPRLPDQRNGILEEIPSFDGGDGVGEVGARGDEGVRGVLEVAPWCVFEDVEGECCEEGGVDSGDVFDGLGEVGRSGGGTAEEAEEDGVGESGGEEGELRGEGH